MFELVLRRLTQHLGCTLERHSALLNKVINLLESLDIGLGKHTVALRILVRFQTIELRLPVANERLIHVEHLGHLTHRVVDLLYCHSNICFIRYFKILSDEGYILFTRAPTRFTNPNACPSHSTRFNPSAKGSAATSCFRRN